MHSRQTIRANEVRVVGDLGWGHRHLGGNALLDHSEAALRGRFHRRDSRSQRSRSSINWLLILTTQFTMALGPPSLNVAASADFPEVPLGRSAVWRSLTSADSRHSIEPLALSVGLGPGGAGDPMTRLDAVEDVGEVALDRDVPASSVITRSIWTWREK